MALAWNHLLPEDNFQDWVEIENKVAQRIEIASSRFNCRNSHDNLNKETEGPNRSELRSLSHDIPKDHVRAAIWAELVQEMG